jgi:FkbH-like protein
MVNIIDILRENNRNKDTNHKIKILYVSNLALIPLNEVLTYNLRLLGIQSEVTTGLFNSPITEIKKYSHNHDVIVINLDIFSSSIDSGSNLNEVSETSLQYLESNYIELINQILSLIPAGTPTIFTSVCVPIFHKSNVENLNLRNIVDRCNFFLNTVTSNNIKILDLEKLIELLGYENVYKKTLSAIETSIYTIGFVKNFGEILAAYVANQMLPYKKLLVLDCDNTLWGGVAAELSAISIENTSLEGKIFHDLQILIKKLSESGVLLALCSKNNEAEVFSVFEENKNMHLDLNDFVSKRINWDRKSLNIQSICVDLNLSPSSVVFVDDSLFEINEVLSIEKQITCLQTPQSLLDYKLFEWKVSIFFLSKPSTSEDTQRTKYYFDEVVRQQATKKYANYEDFLNSLNTKINLFKCNDESQIERIVQLSAKTNQFNFMHSRFDTLEVKKMLEDSSYTIYLASVSDNIGDSGIVLLLVTKNLTNDLSAVRIIEFVLSCRVFGRRIAEQTLDFIIRYLSKSGIQKVYCQFNKTSKNTQFMDFLPNFGFEIYSGGDSDYILSTLEYNQSHETRADIGFNLL